MTEYNFQKCNPFSLRLWHWLNVIVIFGLLLTVLIRKTFLSWRTNAALIEEKLKAAGTVIGSELSKEIAVTIRNPLWDWHIYLGFALAFLLIFRILIVIFVEKSCPLTLALKSALNLKSCTELEKASALHYTLVKACYALFYFATLMMVASGLILYFKAGIGFSKETIATIKETHEVMMWFFIVFVAAHILGLLIAENRKNPGIISDMVNGGEHRAKSSVPSQSADVIQTKSLRTDSKQTDDF